MIKLDFEKQNGLVPLIFQDEETGRVLMLGYVNELAWEKTLETGIVHYWSRSRNKLWVKGETSGHTQKVTEIFIDCDNDTILIVGKQVGDAACHEGYKSCFYRQIVNNEIKIIEDPIFDPNEVYKK